MAYNLKQLDYVHAVPHGQSYNNPWCQDATRTMSGYASITYWKATSSMAIQEQWDVGNSSSCRVWRNTATILEKGYKRTAEIWDHQCVWCGGLNARFRQHQSSVWKSDCHVFRLSFDHHQNWASERWITNLWFSYHSTWRSLTGSVSVVV